MNNQEIISKNKNNDYWVAKQYGLALQHYNVKNKTDAQKILKKLMAVFGRSLNDELQKLCNVVTDSHFDK